jgi:hypothetical protein
MKMSEENPQPAAAVDPPIIVQGGGSVEVDVPAGFTGGTGKKFKNANVNLVSIQINEDAPIPLSAGDKISITYS